MKQLEESVESFLGTLGGIIWGPWVLIPLLAITGLLLTIRLRGIQFTKLIPALRLGIKDRKDADAEEGDVSQFQALTTALAATVGTANCRCCYRDRSRRSGCRVLDVGDGILGMASKYSEAFLAVRFRTKDDAGEASGGPQYYLERGITWRVPVRFWSARSLPSCLPSFAVIASFGIGNLTQANAIAQNVSASWNLKPGSLASFSCLVPSRCCSGGIKSIGKVTEKFVPFDDPRLRSRLHLDSDSLTPEHFPRLSE